MLRWLALFVIAALPAQAQEESIIVDLSQRQVPITANFDGSELLLFGAVKRSAPASITQPLSVIITLAGPSQPVLVRRKAKRFGIWINTDVVEVDSAPSFYAVATSRPLNQVLSNTEDLRHKITIPRAIRSVGAPMTIMDSLSFTEALIRLRMKDNLYQMLPSTVAFFDQTLFKTSVTLPANLTEGVYKVTLYLTRDKQVVSRSSTNIVVRKVGLERTLFRMAHDQPLIYALLSLVIAISAGWLASTAFRYLRR